MFGLGKKSISDLPVEGGIKQGSTDSLHNTPYAEALAKFITNSDTPITIGIQGGWGSGKTSLMNMLEEKIADSSLVVKINAWEYSLFSNKEDVAISLLSGLISELRNAVDDAFHANPKRIEEETRKAALNLPTLSQKALQIGMGALKSVTGMTAKVIVGNAVGNFTGSDLESKNEIRFGEPDQPRVEVSSVKELRKLLTQVISTIMCDPVNSICRVVFLIDDLDRVDPSLAVQILDVLKNVMELRHCVFVVAIDFDVVVQGLKSKYGDKSNQTEREHRQYFDKIIQVPFAMPVNSYRDNIKTLVHGLLAGIGMPCDDNQAEVLSKYAWALTDGTPRSIKRVINTLSLLSLLPNGKQHESENNNIGGNELEILFAFVCLQINFPSVFNQVARTPNISEWMIDTAMEQGVVDSDYENEGLDDGWELVLRGICQRDAWGRKKYREIQESFSKIYEGPIKRIGGTAKLAEILAKLSVTSVNPGSFLETIDGIYDYFVVGEMAGSDILAHSESDGMIIAINWFSGRSPAEIRKVLKQSPSHLVKDIVPSYQELITKREVLGDWTVANVREWRIYNVIANCLGLDSSKMQSIKEIIQNTHGKTKLRKALADYWA